MFEMLCTWIMDLFVLVKVKKEGEERNMCDIFVNVQYHCLVLSYLITTNLRWALHFGPIPKYMQSSITGKNEFSFSNSSSN